ncbi:LOW QUALITY PROTEIN: putative cancer susceptibility gene HEPN1 protein [Diceros bicornis minor]|uniref:LOW QUALITY PROTEIN: putative cancer susceptibility gene HEPN1 protein n=1 Tax=Diceros bicornis minor TaxID=77932 RepID=UPI0026EE1B3F|nr:LOW QUALITY PROTEIN: putative cancer susceptibility gene HEPN1 protein [Diceros bicornis minor]
MSLERYTGTGRWEGPAVQWWGTVALGVALWDGGEAELELKRLRRCGMQGPLEASGRRGQNTQRASFSFSFLIALSPHTVDYCLSYELVKRWWHGHGLATQWPNLSVL